MFSGSNTLLVRWEKQNGLLLENLEIHQEIVEIQKLHWKSWKWESMEILGNRAQQSRIIIRKHDDAEEIFGIPALMRDSHRGRSLSEASFLIFQLSFASWFQLTIDIYIISYTTIGSFV